VLHKLELKSFSIKIFKLPLFKIQQNLPFNALARDVQFDSQISAPTSRRLNVVVQVVG